MDDTDGSVPSLETLFAATLALMTRWAQTVAPASGKPPCRHRSLLARKIVSNLFFLQHHPAAGAQFREIVGNVHRSWQAMACAAPAASSRAPADGTSLH